MSLAQRLIQRIAADGPISVADYMDACLHDPEDGYYATRPALGADGDFITAPHVSQMFGELIGAWTADVWRALGSPARVRLVELGPGDGTMFADLLRAARAWPRFADAIELVLLETSAPLRTRQAESLPESVGRRWISDLGEIGEDVPAILLANEFLDCFPVRQAVCGEDGWRERRVGVCASGGLVFIHGDSVSEVARPGREGEIAEWSPALAEFAHRIARLISNAGGAALFIDYATDGVGDTLQAVGRHRRESPLAHPGEADLTARVDFAAFLAAAAPATTFGPVSQAAFLTRLGLGERAATLSRAHPDRAGLIARQVRRLIAPDQMGELFQVAAIAAPGLEPPGFA